jgi:hypothetical protein
MSMLLMTKTVAQMFMNPTKTLLSSQNAGARVGRECPTSTEVRAMAGKLVQKEMRGGGRRLLFSA